MLSIALPFLVQGYPNTCLAIVEQFTKFPHIEYPEESWLYNTNQDILSDGAPLVSEGR